ncbi:hypothetical protein CC1G_12814 [Coprinopsis cinerea okayama7|uniref:Uncharacterized protein n=1 Tax=Coprinopsis cinerea (strain Okayama-7 / 130 / ATCC MYA-4618 / FGSC 9003) TaxID=240176 RepID=A8P920_COPC7|nr:hypothetical protein CC1G_12814 [Coprinopsis cinerea okayama7\|eukprot:XP_001839679.2 hypothetical protein CC1G_12814 [Coprinopsis cinerea okayama7\
MCIGSAYGSTAFTGREDGLRPLGYVLLTSPASASAAPRKLKSSDAEMGEFAHDDQVSGSSQRRTVEYIRTSETAATVGIGETSASSVVAGRSAHWDNTLHIAIRCSLKKMKNTAAIEAQLKGQTGAGLTVMDAIHP